MDMSKKINFSINTKNGQKNAVLLWAMVTCEHANYWVNMHPHYMAIWKDYRNRSTSSSDTDNQKFQILIISVFGKWLLSCSRQNQLNQKVKNVIEIPRFSFWWFRILHLILQLPPNSTMKITIFQILRKLSERTSLRSLCKVEFAKSLGEKLRFSIMHRLPSCWIQPEIYKTKLISKIKKLSE